MAEEDAQGPTGGLTPHITISGSKGQEAIAFYEQAFGAKELRRQLADDGKRLMHAHLLVNGASLMLNDDFPEMMGGSTTPPPAAITLHLQVDDPGSWWDRAIKAGATERFPLADQFWGDRYGQVQDPFGHTWSIGGPIKG